MSPVDWFWKLFESSGSLDAYLLYRNYQRKYQQYVESDDQVKRKLTYQGGTAID